MCKLFGTSQKNELKAGETAPLFRLPDQTGALFDLEDRKGRWTVLYFYPKDATPGCTKQACVFRDTTGSIHALGAEVYGISKDSIQSHHRFANRHKLSFPLLADQKGEVIKTYGVQGWFGFAKRHTFIIGPSLKVMAVMKGVDPALNASEVVASLQSLQSQETS